MQISLQRRNQRRDDKGDCFRQALRYEYDSVTLSLQSAPVFQGCTVKEPGHGVITSTHGVQQAAVCKVRDALLGR